jgi:subtilisin
MRKTAPLVVLALALLTSTGTVAVAAPSEESATPRIVVFESSVADVDAATRGRERAYGFESRFRYQHALKGFSARLSEQQVSRLEADPAVDFVGVDGTVRAAATAALAPGEPMPPTGVRRIGAATAATAHQASNVNVAVLDTGIDLTHPDLPSAVHGENCITSGASAQDDNWHGTHVAGTIAAANNGAGVVGVAPGTRTYAVKVLDSTAWGSWSQIICGIDWVTGTRTDADPSNDVSVANMSLTGTGTLSGTCSSTSDALRAAICRSTARGVTYVVAAGNNAKPFDASGSTFVPAAYPEVLTVTAMSDSDGRPGGAGSPPSCSTTNTDDSAAGFSNYATTEVGAAHTVAAPGVCIRSTSRGGAYSTANGTSMAAPHLAASVALCMGEAGAAGPCAGSTPAQIVSRMRSEAGTYSGSNASYGFDGDPLRPRAGAYFGFLGWAGVAGSEPLDTAAPGAPAGLTATAGDGTVALDWADNTAADGVAAYHVYRSTAEGGTYTQVARVTASAYTDGTVVNGQTYFFRVAAVDAAGNESAPSATASATPAAPSPEPEPAAAIDLSAAGYKVKGLQHARLTWSGGAPGDFFVLRDGTRIATVRSPDGSGAFEDAIGRKGAGTYVYEVCQQAPEGYAVVCSNAAVVLF